MRIDFCTGDPAVLGGPFSAALTPFCLGSNGFLECRASLLHFEPPENTEVFDYRA